MADIPDFRARMQARWEELREGPLALGAIFSRIDTYEARHRRPS